MSLIGSRFIMINVKGELYLQFRHEVKHEINNFDMLLLRQRLRAVMSPDAYASGGKYKIRSLYFDTPDDKALREKLDGMMLREKYRLRVYNGDYSFIRLERKFKCGELSSKDSAVLTEEQTRAVLEGDIDELAESPCDMIREFCRRVKYDRLSPKSLVDYTREPFVFAPGNVRVTLDHSIRTALKCTEFFDPNCISVPVPDSPCILEVKWDDFLPDIIRNAIQLDNRCASAYSKYAASRMYD